LKIRYKFAVIMTLFGVVIVLLLSAGYGILSHDIVIDKATHNIENLAGEVALRVDSRLKEKIKIAVTLSSAPFIKAALLKSNSEFAAFSDLKRKQEIDRRNLQWKETTEINDPFIRAHMTNPLAEYFKHQQIIMPEEYGEIFLTNRDGVMIATTGKLTTLAHAHKPWWLACYNEGLGRIFLDDRGFDASAQGYVLGVVVPVKDKNEIIGILKCNVNITGLLIDIVQEFDLRNSSRIKIVRTGGLIVSERDVTPLSTQVNGALLEFLCRKEAGTKTITENNEIQLVAFSPIPITLGSKAIGFGGSKDSIDHIKGNKGQGWHIVISLGKEKAIEASHNITLIIIIIGIIFTLLAAFVASLLGKLIAKPIVELSATAKTIGEGSLDTRVKISSKDEVGSLAKSLNRMAENLKKTMTSRDHLVSEVKQRKKAEERVIEALDHLRTVADQVPGVIYQYRLRPDGTACFPYASDKINDIYHVTPEQVREDASDVFGVLHPDDCDRVAESIQKSSRDLTLWHMEYRVKFPDGTVRWLLGDAVPRHEEDGSTIWNGFIADITERKSLESQLQQAQKMESIGRLAGGVAHDFNNKLQVILGYTDMVLGETGVSDPLHEPLATIKIAALHSADLTRQLLTFACKQVISPEVLDLNATVEKMLKMLRRIIGEDIDLLWEPNANLGPVKMDPVQIDQILANLCVNSRDAIGGVGKVIIETKNIQFDQVPSGETCPSGEYVQLSFSDNGCGMNEETLKHLFEPFFTTKEVGQGTGLGLATLHGIARQNHGFITVDSTPGKGTTFKIHLPRCVDEEVETQETAGIKPPERGHETILLVEDEAVLLDLGRQMLEGLGYIVLVANLPEEALRLAEKHSGKIDLMLTDVIMPKMTGQDLAAQLKKTRPNTKFIFMSGYTAEIIARDNVLSKEIPFIQKPFSIDELSTKLRIVLDG